MSAADRQDARSAAKPLPPPSEKHVVVKKGAGSGTYQRETRALSPPPQMSKADVGDYYMHEDGSVWRLTSYAASPTAQLDRVSPADNLQPARLGGCVGAPIFAGFRKLVREETT